MAKTETFKANDRRTAVAHQTVADFGASYLNPLVGTSPAETCANLEHIMGFLHGVMDSEQDITEFRGALALMVQTAWSAVQYEREVHRD